MPPLVSIVVPVFNDAETLAAALESCVTQTLADIEIICVDDASTDASVDVIAQFQSRDPRVRLIRQPTNRSALQARRAGVMAASAEHLLFLDGDDELAPEAASTALARGHATHADITGFGVTVVGADGRTGGRYEQSLQPTQATLHGTEVLRGLFPIGQPAQGQLWRYLFRTQIVRDAYETLPDDLGLRRVNDLPVMFLIASLAASYASTPDRLYRYHLGRGGSGHRVDSLERATFYASAIASVDSIQSAVAGLAETAPDAALVRESYDSVRSWIIAYVCHQLVGRSDSSVLEDALAHLYSQASLTDVVRAATRFFPDTLTTLRYHAPWQDIAATPKSSVLLATSNLRTGGVSAVLLAQARYLLAAGLRVTIVARKAGSDRTLVPAGADFVELTGRGPHEQWSEWGELCRSRGIEVVIDHQVLYTPHWPEFALVARAEGAATIGWVHNFVGRPVYDGTDRLEILENCAATLARVVVLSPLDVAYFKLRGVSHVLFAPNPPSEMLRSAPAPRLRTAPKGRIELVWWGRLDEHTKKISELLAIAEHLRDLEVDFHLTIIGPEWQGLTPKKVNAEAAKRRIADRVKAIGSLQGTELLERIDASDAFVSTSIIEGYQLTIAEAQSRGLPVLMYELPWLALVDGNSGIITAPQGDSRMLATRAAELARDDERYERMVEASLEASQRVHSPDFAALYLEIIGGRFPDSSSPEPTLEDARLLLGLMLFYAERAPKTQQRQPSVVLRLTDRAWRWATPTGQALLRTVPGLRPFARRVKRRFTGR